MKLKMTLRRLVLIGAFVVIVLACSAATVRFRQTASHHTTSVAVATPIPQVTVTPSASPTVSAAPTNTEVNASPSGNVAATPVARPAATAYPKLTPPPFTPPYRPYVQVAPWQFGYSSVEGNSGSYRYVDFYTQASYATGDVTMTVKYSGRLSNGQIPISGSKAVFIPSGYHTTSLDTIITVNQTQCPYGEQITGSFALYYPDGALMQAYTDQTINCPNN